MAGGLVATTTTTAEAAPYPGTVKSKIKATKQKAGPHKARLKITITSNSGRPQGTITIVFVNKKTGKSRTFRRVAPGGHVWRFNMRPGTYNVSISYTPSNQSKWKPSSTRTTVKVRR